MMLLNDLQHSSTTPIYLESYRLLLILACTIMKYVSIGSHQNFAVKLGRV